MAPGRDSPFALDPELMRCPSVSRRHRPGAGGLL